MKERRSWPSYSEKEMMAVSEVLRSGLTNYWTGSNCKLFEEEFADYIGCKGRAISVSNGTVALEIILKALGIGVGDEVIVPSRTYVATASAVAMVGARPVFADIDVNSGNLTAYEIAKCLSKQTRAVIIVHFAGWPCEMKEILELVRNTGLLLIEDCAQAHGATYKGSCVGSFGDAAAFSFCQDKIISTGGEGGMAIFREDEHWRCAWSLKDHGKNYDKMASSNDEAGFKWAVDSIGSNYRMTEMQAAIGRHQLKMLDGWLSQRRYNATTLERVFTKFDFLRIPEVPAHISHARYKLYAYLKRHVDKRDELVREMCAMGVACAHGGCSEVYLERVFQDNGYAPKIFRPNARQLGKSSIMFLVDPSFTKADIQEVAARCEKVLKCYS